MDPTLVNGLLGIAGTLSTGGLGLATLLVKKHMATLDTMVANDTKNSDSIRTIADEIRLTREAQQRQEARITSLEETIGDTRSNEALAQSKSATDALQRALSTITGQFEAVPAQDPDPQVGIQTIRRVGRASKP